MPDSPHNPALSPSSDLTSAPEQEEAHITVSFLPPVVSRLFIGAWILLFAARWLIVQGLMAIGFVGMERVDAAMERCYLFLLSVTLVTLVVRIVQGRKSLHDPIASKMDFNAQEVSASAAEGAAGADTSDTGGKQA